MSADAASISRRLGVRLVARRWINLCAALVALLLSQGEFVPASPATTTLVTASTYNYDRTDANAQRASRSVAFASVRTIRLAPASTAHGSVSRRSAHFLAAEEGSIVYRGLAEGEDFSPGLTARNPGAGNDIVSHIAGRRDSQWISTTKSSTIAQERFGQHGVVAIDLSRVGADVVDASAGIPGMPSSYMLSRWAANTQEVLIRGGVPREAIVGHFRGVRDG